MLSAPGTSIVNSLNSPGIKGSVGTVTQEEAKKITPLVKRAIHIDHIFKNLLWHLFSQASNIAPRTSNLI
jgi:hypothetical protein